MNNSAQRLRLLYGHTGSIAAAAYCAATHRQIRMSAIRGLGDLDGDVGERQQPRTGQLVHLPDVPVLGERRDRDVGDVVDVDERFRHVPGRQRDHTVEHGLEQEVLAEVLGEPARPHDRPVGAGLLHGALADLGLLLAAAGQQHQPADAARHRGSGERADGLGGAGERQVGVVHDVDRGHVPQRRLPGGGVVPVERRRARARPDPGRHATGREALGNPAAGLAGAAEDEGHVVMSMCHCSWCQ